MATREIAVWQDTGKGRIATLFQKSSQKQSWQPSSSSSEPPGHLEENQFVGWQNFHVRPRLPQPQPTAKEAATAALNQTTPTPKQAVPAFGLRFTHSTKLSGNLSFVDLPHLPCPFPPFLPSKATMAGDEEIEETAGEGRVEHKVSSESGEESARDVLMANRPSTLKATRRCHRPQPWILLIPPAGQIAERILECIRTSVAAVVAMLRSRSISRSP